MNIAILPNKIFLGGRTIYVTNLSEEFIKKGHKVFIFTTGPKFENDKRIEKRMRDLSELGAEIVTIDKPKEISNPIFHRINLAFSLIKLEFLFRIKKIDIIHVQDSEMAFLVGLLRRKFVKTIHRHYSKYTTYRRKATHEIAISRGMYKELKEAFQYKPSEISLIFNGSSKRFAELIEDSKKETLKTSLHLPKDRIIISIIGSPYPLKGQDILLEAIDNLKPQLKRKIHLIMVGHSRNKKEQEWFESLLIDYSHLKNNISIFKYGDPKPYYDVSDIFVSSSRGEAFGLVIAEAQLSGCCIVKSNIGSANDQIEDGVNGFLFENKNVYELKNILSELIVNDEKRKMAGVKGREYALKHFTSSIMAEKTLQVYNKIIKTN